MDQPASTFDYQSHLAACARGERPALQALYDQEGARLLGVARRIVRDDSLAAHGSARIHQCLEQLEPARRRCILHAYVDGCTHAEIAALLGAPLGTVKAWIKRSLASLRECMG